MKKIFMRKLTKITVMRSGNDQLCRNIPLHPLEPDVFGETGFAVGNEPDQILFRIGQVFTLFP
jgi:hypothetical protein